MATSRNHIAVLTARADAKPHSTAPLPPSGSRPDTVSSHCGATTASNKATPLTMVSRHSNRYRIAMLRDATDFPTVRRTCEAVFPSVGVRGLPAMMTSLLVA